MHRYKHQGLQRWVDKIDAERMAGRVDNAPIRGRTVRPEINKAAWNVPRPILFFNGRAPDFPEGVE